MSHITTIELIGAADAPLLLRDMYAAGDPGPIVGALAHVPELTEATLPFVGSALGPSAISFREKEIAILRTSANLSCAYCTNAHTVVAFEGGLSHGEVRALRGEGTVADAFDDERERTLIEWIDALCTYTQPIRSELAERARETLGTPDLVELTVTVGATMFLNRFATSLGLPTSDDTFQRLAEFGLGDFGSTTPVDVAPSRSAGGSDTTTDRKEAS